MYLDNFRLPVEREPELVAKRMQENGGKSSFNEENQDNNDSMTGVIIKPSDVNTLRESLVLFRDLPGEVLAKMGENAIKIIKDYTFEKMAEAHAAIGNISRK